LPSVPNWIISPTKCENFQPAISIWRSSDCQTKLS